VLRQPFQSTAAGNEPESDFDLAEACVLPAREAKVAGEEEFVADAAGTSADLRDADDRGRAEPVAEAGPVLDQVLRSGNVGNRSHAREIQVRDEEVGVGAFQDEDLYTVARVVDVLLQEVEAREDHGVEQVQRRVIDHDPQATGGNLGNGHDVALDQGRGGGGERGRAHGRSLFSGAGWRGMCWAGAVLLAVRCRRGVVQ